jgi:hypothetical protein
MKRILDKIDRPVKLMSDNLREVRDGLEGKLLRVYRRLLVIFLVSKRTEILRWLSPEPYIQHHTQAKKDVIPVLESGFLQTLFSRGGRELASPQFYGFTAFLVLERASMCKYLSR